MEKGLNASQLKLIAIVSMVIDHIAWGFFNFYTWQAQLLHICGRLTIPIMCFFIAEGYKKTSNLKRYVSRMVFFWLVSVIPFYLFFHEEYEYRQNIIFDLLLSLLFLICLENKKLLKWQKTALCILIFAISLSVGGWPVLPILYVAIFYYSKDFKSSSIWFCITTIALVIIMMAVISLNQTYHFLHYNWIWYEKTYFLGFMLALPLLYLYNGFKGNYPVGRYFFYCFYPLHFLVLFAFKKMFYVYSSYMVYVSFQIITLVLAIYVVYEMLKVKSSRSQSGSLIFGCSAIVYMFGFLLEVTTTDLSGAYQAVKVEYFGECFIIIGFTLFFSEFCRMKIPRWIYYIEGLISLTCMYLIFSTENNHIFYKNMYMNYDGPHSRLILEYGPGFYCFFGYLGISCLLAMAVFWKNMHKGTSLSRMRFSLMFLSMICPWIPLIIRATGITGGYEVSFLGIMGSSLCIMVALVKFGYFDSVQQAGTNALFNANEGLMVIDTDNRILYCNRRLNEWFPDAVKFSYASEYMDIPSILAREGLRTEIGTSICDIMAEALVEMGEIQGYLIRIIDMTEHYNKLEQAEKSAHIDALTGLWDRELFKITMMDFIKSGGTGTMFMMDIDNFKGINDNYGHDIGDKALITLGNTLSDVFRKPHLCCRLGGDEFAAFLINITDTEEIAAYAKRLSILYKKKISLLNSKVVSTISIGAASVNTHLENVDKDTFEDIYCQADAAMYESKKKGKDTWSIKEFLF